MRPLVVTMGDAAGIGPEIIVRAFERGALLDAVVIGDPGVLRRAGAAMTAVIDSPLDLPQVPSRCLPLCVPPGLPPDLAQLPRGGRLDRALCRHGHECRRRHFAVRRPYRLEFTPQLAPLGKSAANSERTRLAQNQFGELVRVGFGAQDRK